MQTGGHADWLAWSRALPDDTATTHMPVRDGRLGEWDYRITFSTDTPVV